MRLVFRTQIQDLWGEWDPRFLREVAAHASMICVRIAGLVVRDRVEGPYTSDEPAILEWERAIKHLVHVGRGERRYGIAFAVVRAGHYPRRRRPWERGAAMAFGQRMYRQWTRTLPFAERVAWLLRLLRAETQTDILLHVEDLSARWALESGFRPDLWLMDNPFVGFEEARDRWSGALSRPGLLRRSELPRLGDWPSWRMHLRPDELLAAHLPVTGTHGVWTRRARLGPFIPLTRMIPRARATILRPVSADAHLGADA